MKITWKHGDRSVEFERKPMPPERFAALCKLAGDMIDGVVLLGLVHMVGARANAWAVGVLVAVGFYSLAKEGFR